jgi:molybdopterin molybdotransferase
MIHPDDAIRLINEQGCRLGSETVVLAEALGRIPARAVAARLDQPGFDKATMDGFAYRAADGAMADAGAGFELVDSIPAGSPPPAPLAAGRCARIMTGAPLPEGASAVHRLERAEASGGRVYLSSREDDLNIVRRGANRRSGDPLVSRRPLRPQDIALLASDGLADIEVVARPRVAVISTGCELRPAGDDLALGSIYDSNGPLLASLAREAGCAAAFAGIVTDDEGALVEAVSSASRSADLILLSGGVSAGDFDFVPAALERLGFGILFHKVAVRPGKPFLFARRGALFACGMPGNPVSAFIDFKLFVMPLIMRFAGLPYAPPLAYARMGAAAERAAAEREAADRVEFLPVELREGRAYPLRYTGSTMLDVLSRADAFVRLEIGQREIPEGAEAIARLV